MKKILIFIAVWSFALIAINTVTAQDLEILKEENLSTSQGNTVNVSTFAGDVAISTWDKSEVGVKVMGNNNAKEVMEYKSSTSGDNVKIEIKSSKKNKSNIQLKVEVQVPSTYNVEVKTAGGDITLKGLYGNIEMKTAGGDIKVDDITGNADLKTAGGDINAQSLKGNIEASTAGGDINISSSDGIVEAKTAGGDINVDYSGTNMGIECKTSGGDIILKLPESIAGNFELKTSSGEIKSDFSLSIKEKSGTSKATGSVNGGGNSVECSTSGGDILIKKK